jgi:hypothetical protein
LDKAEFFLFCLGLFICIVSIFGIYFVAFAFDYTPENYLAYYQIYLNDENRNVHLWFVESGADIPICEKENDKYLYGCTRYFKDPYHPDYIYVVATDKLDRYGNTFLAHELKHVICGCNWH